MRKLVFCVFYLLCVGDVYGAQIINAANDSELSGVIAKEEISRIKVISDRIKSVKNVEGEVEVLEDTDLGEIYIRPLKSKGEPINLFITTERNDTYKLLLLPKSQPSAQIFIRNEEAISASSKQMGQGDSYKDKVINLIKKMRVGEGGEVVKRAKGFTKEKYNLKLLKGYSEQGLVGEVYEVSHKEPEPQFIDYEVLGEVGVIAISAEDEELLPNITGYLYVVREVVNG